MDARRGESGLIVVERRGPTSANAAAGHARAPDTVPSATPAALWTPTRGRAEPAQGAAALAFARAVDASGAVSPHSRLQEWKPKVDLSAYDGLVKLGYDVEFFPEGLAALIRRGYFDVEGFERRVREDPKLRDTVLTERLLSGYIMQPGALESLPQTVRDALGVANLNLQGPTVALPGQSEQQSSAATRVTRASGLSVPRGTEWQELQRRWDALPLEVKQNAVPLTKVDALTLARMVGSIPVSRNVSYEGIFDMSPTAPAWLRRSVLKGERQPGRSSDTVFEFALKGVSGKPNEFLVDLMTLAHQTGTLTQVEQPLGHQRANSRLHIHLSVPGKEFWDIASQWQRLLLVRSLAGGEANHEGLLKGPYSYSRTLQGKGMVESVSSDHVELRHHAASPEAELAEFLRYALMPAREAVAAMDGEIRAVLDLHPEVLETIARVNPRVRADFQRILEPPPEPEW